MKLFKNIIFVSAFLSLSIAQYYSVGDVVNAAHQNQGVTVCSAGEGYANNSTLRLGDFNGATNGGDYHVIGIDMSASW